MEPDDRDDEFRLGGERSVDSFPSRSIFAMLTSETVAIGLLVQYRVAPTLSSTGPALGWAFCYLDRLWECGATPARAGYESTGRFLGTHVGMPL